MKLTNLSSAFDVLLCTNEPEWRDCCERSIDHEFVSNNHKQGHDGRLVKFVSSLANPASSLKRAWHSLATFQNSTRCLRHLRFVIALRMSGFLPKSFILSNPRWATFAFLLGSIITSVMWPKCVWMPSAARAFIRIRSSLEVCDAWHAIFPQLASNKFYFCLIYSCLSAFNLPHTPCRTIVMLWGVHQTGEWKFDEEVPFLIEKQLFIRMLTVNAK